MLAAGSEAGAGPGAGAGVWVVPLSVCVRPTPCFTCAANTPPREPSARPHRHVLSFLTAAARQSAYFRFGSFAEDTGSPDDGMKGPQPASTQVSGALDAAAPAPAPAAAPAS